MSGEHDTGNPGDASMNADAPAIPDFLAPLLAQQYCAADVERILEGYSCSRAVTLRANTLTATRDNIAAALDEAGLAWQPVPWYPDAFALRDARERDIWELAAYAEGKVYLQSLSSMLPALVLGARPGEDVLDMCAAPGGKTSQIAALAGGRAYLTACEMHAPRAEKLEHNLAKLHVPNITVMRVDSRRLDDFFSFDRILLDAPCSGSGTLRAHDAKSARRFTPALIEKSRKAQRALFAKALRLLKPGGTLVYSTCSVLACENEDIVMEGLASTRRAGAFEIEPIDALGDVGGSDASSAALADDDDEPEPSRGSRDRNEER